MVSRGLKVRPPQGSNPGAIALPTNNPLASITEIADIGKVGIHTGVLLGGMAHQIHGALIRTDLPLDERMMMMTRGSAAVGNALLGAVEFFRTLNETANGPIKEVNDGQ